MKAALRALVFAGAASIASAASASIVSASEPADAVLKIDATQLVSDYGAPWRSAASRTVCDAGFVVAGRRILTNAHVVSDATFIQVRRHGESERFAARVLYVSHETDLALLTVDEPGFFDSVTPLSLGGLPELREEVLVLGFPVGDDTLSITRGVVSRIEHQVYVLTAATRQPDRRRGEPGNAADRPRAEGVGVAMQPRSAPTTSPVIPTRWWTTFTDVADGPDGVPAVPFRGSGSRRPTCAAGTRAAAFEDRRARAGDDGRDRGGGVLRRDVLLSIDGRTVGTDGTIEFRPREYR